MNEIIKSLHNRKSVRVFEETPISEHCKSAIIDAAIQAPTAGAQCLYTMIDITDENLKSELAILCDNQPFIAKAPLVIIFLADCRRWLDSYIYAGETPRLPSESDLLLAMADAVIAAQNTVVAAESLGIGSCYIGDIIEQEEQLRKLINLDDYTLPAAMLVYGYPTQKQKDRKKPKRFDKKYLLQENSYKRLSKQEHIDMHTQTGNIDNTTFENYIGAFFKRKYMSDFSKEMSRSAKRYLEHFIGDDSFI